MTGSKGSQGGTGLITPEAAGHAPSNKHSGITASTNSTRGCAGGGLPSLTCWFASLAMVSVATEKMGAVCIHPIGKTNGKAASWDVAGV